MSPNSSEWPANDADVLYIFLCENQLHSTVELWIVDQVETLTKAKELNPWVRCAMFILNLCLDIFSWLQNSLFKKLFGSMSMASQCIDADVVHIFLHTCIVTNIFLCEYHCIALKNQIWITCINKGKSSTDALVIMTLEKRVLKISERDFLFCQTI